MIKWYNNRTPYTQENVNIGTGPPGSKVRWFRSASNEPRFINTITFDSKQDSPTLVMVHGYAAAQGFFFRNFDALTKHFRVIAIDQLGWVPLPFVICIVDIVYFVCFHIAFSVVTPLRAYLVDVEKWEHENCSPTNVITCIVISLIFVLWIFRLEKLKHGVETTLMFVRIRHAFAFDFLNIIVVFHLSSILSRIPGLFLIFSIFLWWAVGVVQAGPISLAKVLKVSYPSFILWTNMSYKSIA